MNKHEIDKHPEWNGGKQKITKQVTHTEVDTDTGEIKRVLAENESFNKEIEPPYVKIYTDCQLVFNNLNAALSPYIIAFGRHMTYANFNNPHFRCTVRTDEITRKDVAKVVGVSDRQVQNAIKELVNSEVFIPIEFDGKRKRGLYFVNPWVMAKGEWKDIKELRAGYEFVSGATSVVKINSEGEKQIIMPLTQRSDGQLEMFIEDSENNSLTN